MRQPSKRQTLELERVDLTWNSRSWYAKYWQWSNCQSRKDHISSSEHIKLGRMKQFVRALNTDGECFQYTVSVLLPLSYEKIKAGVFNGSQIRAFVRDQDFVRKMNDKERGVWFSFVAIMENFLGNKKANSYETFLSLSVFGLLSSSLLFFIVISTTFRPICPPAFFRCLSNSGTFTELRTTSFIESTGVACSDSVSHNQVRVLSIPVLLLDYS